MNKALKTTAILVRSVIRILLFVIFSINACGTVEFFLLRNNESAIIKTALPYVGTIVVLLSFFSIVRYAVLFDREMREAYMKQHESIESFSEKIRYFFGYKKIKIAFCAVFVIYWICPIDWCPVRYAMFGVRETVFTDKLILFPFVAVALGIIAVRAHISALNFWSEDVFITRHRRFNYSYANYAKKTLVMTAAYIFGSIIFIYGAKTVLESLILNVAYFNRRSLISITTLVVCFLVIPFIFRNIGALIKRKKFIKKLRAICDEYRCSLSEIKHPYKSLFKKYNEYNFEFERDGKTYTCKFLSSKHRLRPMTFYEDGIGAVAKVIRIKKTELFRINKYFSYSFESEGKKLLVINPVPKMLYISERGQTLLIDNGDRVGEYKIYSGTALINAIDRNTLDR